MGFQRILTILCVSSCNLLSFDFFVASSECPQVASSIDTRFMFGVPSNVAAYGNIGVHITSASSKPANVRVTAPYINFDKAFVVNNSTTVRLPSDLLCSEGGRQLKGIEVFADINITVTVITLYGTCDTEGFLVLPTSALSTRYIAASYQSSAVNYFPNTVLVVGTENNTHVTIEQSLGQYSLSLQQFVLQKFQNYQLLAGYDVSGAIISSNKPVAVLSSSMRARIPVGVGYENYLVEQLIPTRYWVSSFIVPPIYPRNFYIVRIYADNNDTAVQFYNHTNHVSINLKQGSWYELMFGSDPTVILANKPISVVQYCVDDDNMDGNPFMTTVQGMQQFTTSYRFITENDHESTIALILSNSSWQNLQLNGRNIANWHTVTMPVAAPLSNYTTIFVNITSATFFELRHVNDERFGATLYGLFTYDKAFGYPLEFAFSGTDCEHQSLTSTQETITTVGSGTIPHLKPERRNGTWCMDCDNMSHLQFCDKVTRCFGLNEVCYVQSYSRSHSLTMFKSGCMTRTLCSHRLDHVTCQHCCDGDFCNTMGCGDPGFPDNHQRGPVCFDCSHQGDEDTCQAVQMCSSDQICKIDKFQWGNGFHYTMECTDKAACASQRDIHNIFPRYVLACSQCCAKDFCNRNCTDYPNPGIIG